MDKLTAYLEMVQRRKNCEKCLSSKNFPDIVNPSNSPFDTDEIGHWSRWQANLDAGILIIGQDWGDFTGFKKWKGDDSDTNPTNLNLQKLLRSIGVSINAPTKYEGKSGFVFLTNAILCLKNSSAGMQAKIKREWVENCGQEFLKPLVELVSPKVVISLGAWAYSAMQNLYQLEKKSFRAIICEYDSPYYQPVRLPNQSYYFPMYHCGRRVVNSQRGLSKQMLLWKKIKPYT